MAEKSNWEDYRPSKAVWFWSCVGAAVVTVVVGFAWGGWTTASGARELAADATKELVASICVGKFVSGPGYADRLAELKKANTWQRSDMIEEGGWVTLAGMEKPFEAASGLCAGQLADMQAPAEGSVETGTAGSG